ncbi:von Hippel-Lindau-like protein [Phlebotomus papatasi]|uniref:von Hippel-Lindau-like protein n=1 Tax=Phlebotomus papatasi TaxID=29031 RepID=UPI0024840833|nr:von Hippel-Lindau-like protein [Phlebotomus papatasi]
MSDLPELRSKESTHRAFVLFHNTTRRQVELFWMDYQGKPVSYGILQADEKRKIDTFCTHPWSFVDPITQEKLMVDGKLIYYPTVWYEGAIDLVKMTIRRKVARIHHGVRTLKEIALEMVAMQLPDVYQAQDLELPQDLVQEVQRVHKELFQRIKPVAASQ